MEIKSDPKLFSVIVNKLIIIRSEENLYLAMRWLGVVNVSLYSMGTLRNMIIFHISLL